MPTTKKTSSKKAPAKKSTAASKSTKKPASAKPTAKSSPSKEDKVAADALKLVDEAAALLRSGIRTGSKNTSQARAAAAKKAHTLLTKATGGLSSVLSGTTSALHKAIKKLEP
jgi:hypothetical protein